MNSIQSEALTPWVFRLQTIRKLHDRNPTMEYSYLKEMAEEMWNVLYDHEKEVYEKISQKEAEEYQKQLERREVLDYALNTLGIVDPRYLWVAEQGDSCILNAITCTVWICQWSDAVIYVRLLCWSGWRAPLPSEDWVVWYTHHPLPAIYNTLRISRILHSGGGVSAALDSKDALDDQERVYYYDQVNDVSQWEHPLDAHFQVRLCIRCGSSTQLRPLHTEAQTTPALLSEITASAH
jgi:hypothetical protein